MIGTGVKQDRKHVLAAALAASQMEPHIAGVDGTVCTDAFRWYFGYSQNCLDEALSLARGGLGYGRGSQAKDKMFQVDAVRTWGKFHM
jgi:hypothetical protein